MEGAIYKQFGAELVSSTLDFSVGYINSKVTVNVDDIWNMIISKGEAVNLRCDRVTKRDEESSENESKRTVLYATRVKKRSMQLSVLENMLKAWLKSSARNTVENLLPCSYDLG